MSIRSAVLHRLRSQARPPQARPLVLLGAVGWLGVVGCGGLEPVSTYELETDPAQLYLALTVEPLAITLDTATGYNTVQLTATPRDGHGDAMAGLPAPTFRLATPGDSLSLRVTPAGLLTGVNAGSNIEVIAELTVPGPSGYPVRHEERARVSIKTTTPPQVFASLSIDPVPPDSAVVSVLSGAGLLQLVGFLRPTTLTPVALDAGGQPISGVVIEYASLDPGLATVDRWSGQIHARFPGQARLVARAMVSGVTRADTTVFTLTSPVEQLVNINTGAGGIVFEPRDVQIAQYGVVEWSNNVNNEIDIVFDDPTNVTDPTNGTGVAPLLCFLVESSLADPEVCADGNMDIPSVDRESNPDAAGFRVRQFSVPGVYRFHSVRTGVAGQIVVTGNLP